MNTQQRNFTTGQRARLAAFAATGVIAMAYFAPKPTLALPEIKLPDIMEQAPPAQQPQRACPTIIPNLFQMPELARKQRAKPNKAADALHFAQCFLKQAVPNRPAEVPSKRFPGNTGNRPVAAVS